MHNFSYSLSGFLKDLKRKSAQNLSYSSVVDFWPEIVGARTAQNTRAMYIRDSILYVEVFSSVWLNEIKFIREDIIEKYNEKFKKEILKDIHFSIKRGSLDDKSKSTLNKPKIQELKEDLEFKVDYSNIIKELNQSELNFIDYQVSKIKITDEKVVRHLKSFLISSRLRELNLVKIGYKRCERCQGFYKEETGCLPCSFRDTNEIRNATPLDS